MPTITRYAFPPRPTFTLGFYLGFGLCAGAMAAVGVAHVAAKLLRFVGVL